MCVSTTSFQYRVGSPTLHKEESGGAWGERHEDWKGISYIFFMYNIIVYVGSPKESTKKLLKLTSELNNIARLVVFINVSNKCQNDTLQHRRGFK